MSPRCPSRHILLFSFILALSWSLKGQVQIADDIAGLEGGASIASTISKDGTTFVTAQPDVGVKAYRLFAEGWTQIGQTITSENALYIVDCSSTGNRIAVSTVERVDLSDYTAHIQVYDLVGGQWVLAGETISIVQGGNSLGAPVALSNDGGALVVGSSLTPSSPGGQVEVYDYNNSAWVKRGQTILGTQGDSFARDLDISGDGNTIAVGAPFFGVTNNSLNGKVEVYTYTAGTWQQQGAAIVNDGNSTYLGISVSLSGDGRTVACGAYFSEAPTSTSNFSTEGEARVYQLIGSSWSQLGSTIYGYDFSDYLGRNTCLSDDAQHLVVSSSDTIESYQLSAGEWEPFPYGILVNGSSSNSVSVSGNGERVAISRNITGADNWVSRVYDMTELRSIPPCDTTFFPIIADSVVLTNDVEEDREFCFHVDVMFVQLLNGDLSPGNSANHRITFTDGATGEAVILDEVGQVEFLEASSPLSNFIMTIEQMIEGTDTLLWTTDFISFQELPIGAPGVLPVSLSFFTALPQEKAVLLRWESVTENESWLFEVEHSTTGEEWRTIGEVRAAGYSNTERDYRWEHKYPVLGSNFYRLKQIDRDLTFTYSPIASVDYQASKSKVIAYPNPTSGEIALNIPNEYSSGTISLYNSNGQLALRQPATVPKMFLSALPPGQYLINVVAEAGVLQQLVILR